MSQHAGLADGQRPCAADVELAVVYCVKQFTSSVDDEGDACRAAQASAFNFEVEGRAGSLGLGHSWSMHACMILDQTCHRAYTTSCTSHSHQLHHRMLNLYGERKTSSASDLNHVPEKRCRHE